MNFQQFPTTVDLPISQDSPLPSSYDFQDVRYSRGFVKYFVERYSNPEDTVLDPFVGFGTTMIVAEKMKRKAYGVEIDEKKVEYLRSEYNMGDNLVHGDIKRLYLDKLFPPINLIITSPPYMGREDSANALTGYRYAGDYSRYLEEMKSIFSSLSTILSDNGIVLVEISNLKQAHSRTTLAWDVGIKLSEIMRFEGEIIINWKGNRDAVNGIYNYGYDHSYCLVYSKSL